MKQLVTQYRGMPTVTRLLLVNQFTINLGFYMLMPYLAQHLAGTLGLAAWLVGLVLGVRNLSQQGLFALGGALADRFGYKPLIVAGCVLRTFGFAMLAMVESVPALVIASAATGLAGALFNPAVRAYLAVDAGPRRVEAFALFNVFYQAGILAGPLVGLALTGASFRLTCAVAAAVFAVLSIIQIRALPPQQAGTRSNEGILAQWRVVIANRPFLLFATAMICSYVLSFQVYLALPLEVRRIGGDDTGATLGVAALFVASGLVTVLAQTRLTAWCRARIPAGYALALGVATMAAAFLPLLATAALPRPSNPAALWALAVTPSLAAAVLLAIGTMLAFPFEMDTIVNLAGGRLVATHYGIYNTICGIGITAGNLLTGAALDTARNHGLPGLPWLALTTLGALSAVMIIALHRTGRLTSTSHSVTTTS
ncbi:MFS transporter [Kribbella albertanoniae]|nr:MFS transporter [Kribbella albertanoniae]